MLYTKLQQSGPSGQAAYLELCIVDMLKEECRSARLEGGGNTHTLQYTASMDSQPC